MGFDGGHRAGYKQVSKNVDSYLITATCSKTSGDWSGFEVISTGAQIALGLPDVYITKQTQHMDGMLDVFVTG